MPNNDSLSSLSEPHTKKHYCRFSRPGGHREFRWPNLAVLKYAFDLWISLFLRSSFAVPFPTVFSRFQQTHCPQISRICRAFTKSLDTLAAEILSIFTVVSVHQFPFNILVNLRILLWKDALAWIFFEIPMPQSDSNAAPKFGEDRNSGGG